MKTSFEEQYFSFNRITLLALGLWPYQQSKLIHLQVIFFLGVISSFIVFLLSRLVLVECSFKFTIKMLSISLLYTFLVIKYAACWINMKTIRCLLEELQYIYNGLQDRNEIAMYNKYGNIAKRFTIGILLAEIIIVFSLTVIQCWPFIFDVIMPKNETYARHVMILLSKYYVIQEKYCHLILLHLDAACILGSLALVAVGGIMLSYIKHICGMFRIASYRLERAIMTDTLQCINLKNEFAVCKKIIHAVDIHCKAMEFAQFFVSNFERSFFCVFGIIVICVSLNLYHIFQIESLMEEVEEVVIHAAIIFFVLVYMFLTHNAGQEIMDYNNHVFCTAYNIPWYLAPVHIQKMILFLLQRNSKAFTLNVSGIFVASLECFASMASASVSYFTLMLSLQ